MIVAVTWGRRALTAGLLLSMGLAAAPAEARAQALIDLSSGRGLFDNVKAADVGDIITIIIVESAEADVAAKTDTQSKGEVSGGPGLGILDLINPWGLDFENKYKGDGKSSRSGSLRARISVRVIERLPNGNLRIEGRRLVTVNGEKQVITLRGLIRSRDLSANNSIESTYVADAEILYDGEGPVARGHQPGLFTRLVNWLF